MRRRPFDRGRWQTHRERCRIEDEVPADLCEGARRVGEVVPALMASLQTRAVDWSDEIAARWVGLVGADVARHVRPGRYCDGRLVLFADSATWLAEIRRFRIPAILSALQGAFGGDRIRAIAVEPDPDLPSTSAPVR